MRESQSGAKARLIPENLGKILHIPGFRALNDDLARACVRRRLPTRASGAILTGMRAISTAAFPLAAALLAGCASGVAAVDCAALDWKTLGLEDGKAGARPKKFEERANACAVKFSADVAAYDAGRTEGLEFYCSSKGGFAAGRTGEDYSGVCASETELAFFEGHALGARLHELTLAKEKAVREYEAAIADLDQHHYLLKVSEKRYVKPSISNEDREQERQDAEFRRREIARIEGKLPAMLDEIDATKVALDAYRIELLSMGLEL